MIKQEGDVTDYGFLERMNTLLANGEVPGLFEGDEHCTELVLHRARHQMVGTCAQTGAPASPSY
jgi:hypothetical protein